MENTSQVGIAEFDLCCQNLFEACTVEGGEDGGLDGEGKERRGGEGTRYLRLTLYFRFEETESLARVKLF